MARLLDGATGLLIEGKWRSGGPESPVIDKYTQRQFAAVRQASPDDVRDAVTAAARAAGQPLPPMRRYEILSAASRLLGEHAAEVCANYVAETGLHDFRRCRAELARAVAMLRLSAEEAVRISGEEVPVAAAPGSEQRLAFTIRVPVGVVAAIAPFNAPLNTVAHKIGAGDRGRQRGRAQARQPDPAVFAGARRRSCCEAGLPPGLPATWSAARVPRSGNALAGGPADPVLHLHRVYRGRAAPSSSIQASPRRTWNWGPTALRSSPPTPT